MFIVLIERYLSEFAKGRVRDHNHCKNNINTCISISRMAHVMWCTCTLEFSRWGVGVPRKRGGRGGALVNCLIATLLAASLYMKST